MAGNDRHALKLIRDDGEIRTPHHSPRAPIEPLNEVRDPLVPTAYTSLGASPDMASSMALLTSGPRTTPVSPNEMQEKGLRLRRRTGTARIGPWLGVLLKDCYNQPNQDCGSRGLRVEWINAATRSAGWDFDEKIIWAGGSWDKIRPPSGDLLQVGFDQGIPMGETPHRGGDRTGMSSDCHARAHRPSRRPRRSARGRARAEDHARRTRRVHVGTNLNDRGTNPDGWGFWQKPLYRDGDNRFNYHTNTPPNWHPCTAFGSPDYNLSPPKFTDSSLSNHHYYIQKDTTSSFGSGCPG
jgi:hypothetical protein